jgi:hypothetical protein
MSQKEDLRLLYLAADKAPVTAIVIEDLVLRAFAAHFCGTVDDEMTTTTLEYLTNCLAQLRVDEARAAAETEAQLDDAVPVLQGQKAEEFYVNTVKQLLIENGDDPLYAEESASWPDVMPYSALWCPDILIKIAKLETGQDLMVRDCLQAMALRHRRYAQESKNG